MGNKLYIDESCRICTSYGLYINSNKSLQLEIKDIKDLEEDLKIMDQIVYKTDNKCYLGVDGIIKSMEETKKSIFFINILKTIPNFIIRFIYRLIASNRYRISKLISIVKPKS